jgi:hypothetical protein
METLKAERLEKAKQNTVEEQNRKTEEERLAKLKKAQEDRDTSAWLWGKKRFFLEGEFGAGHMAGLSFGYRIKRFSLGLTGGFDSGTFDILGETYHEYLYNVSGLAGFELFRSGYLWSDIYTKFGGEYYSASGYTASGFMIQPGLKLGLHWLFVDLSLPVVLGLDQPVYVFQLGAGFRARWNFRTGIPE